MKVRIKNAPAGHWYEGMVGQEFEVQGWSDTYEGWFVTGVEKYVGRMIYADDCEIVSKSGYIDWTESRTDELKTDPIVDAVISKFHQRSQTGIKKYGKTLERDDLSFTDWVNHAMEEAMDFILYLQKLKQEHESMGRTK